MKPFLFNTEMVRALLAGTKTATRRVVKPMPPNNARLELVGDKLHAMDMSIERPGPDDHRIYTPPCLPGDILYVRETWFYEMHMEDKTEGEPDLPSGRYSDRYVFRADNPDYPVDVGVGATGWRPSIHMPKEAARIFLQVTDAQVEHLCEITVEGARDEGCIDKFDFAGLWDSTIKPADLDKYGWDADPWVWVIEFERISKEAALHDRTS